jgi:hypothetical protein
MRKAQLFIHYLFFGIERCNNLNGIKRYNDSRFFLPFELYGNFLPGLRACVLKTLRFNKLLNVWSVLAVVILCY